MQFAPLYDIPVEEALVSAQATLDPRPQLGLEAPRPGVTDVRVDVDVWSPAPGDRVRQLIEHAHRACHGEHSIRRVIPVDISAKINREPVVLSAGGNPGPEPRDARPADGPSCVDLTRLAGELASRRRLFAGEPGRMIPLGATGRVIEDFHMEGAVDDFVIPADHAPEAGGKGLAAAPLDPFLYGAAFSLLTQLVQFSPVYGVPLAAATVDARGTINVRDKLGMEGPGAQYTGISLAVSVDSAAEPEAVRRLLERAVISCPVQQVLRHEIDVGNTPRHNGEPISL